MTLKYLKPQEVRPEPVTFGEHLKQRRLALHLTQREACPLLGGIAIETLINWEKGRTTPPIRSIPHILSFLGYDPFPEPQTLSERMRAKRRKMGWTIKEAAQRLGVDESTWWTWEQTGVVQWERYRKLLEAFLGNVHVRTRTDR